MLELIWLDHFPIKILTPAVFLPNVTYGGEQMEKPRVSKKQMESVHPYIPDAYEKLEQGRISRREFIRVSTLLGMSAGVATFAAACGAGGTATVAPAEEAPAEEVAAPSGGIKRGGTWTSSTELQIFDHPARLSWVAGSNVVRQVSEYLTLTGTDNITRPYLLDKWEADEDVTVWDLFLKEGIKFNNGDVLTADDVMFTYGEWLNEDVGSSMLGLLSYLSGMQDVEKVDDHHIRLHLQSGNIGVPEHLFHYPAVILHRDFEGDFVRQPIGTG